MPRPRAIPSGMGTWACSEAGGGATDAVFLFYYIFLFFLFGSPPTLPKRVLVLRKKVPNVTPGVFMRSFLCWWLFFGPIRNFGENVFSVF